MPHGFRSCFGSNYRPLGLEAIRESKEIAKGSGINAACPSATLSYRWKPGGMVNISEALRSLTGH